jgi:DNA binding domain, excisionase family
MIPYPEKSVMDEGLWNVKDVAKFLQVKESAVRRWVYEKRIAYCKVGTLVRFAPSQVKDDAINSNIGKYNLVENSNKKLK